jgi:hypothetical protein
MGIAEIIAFLKALPEMVKVLGDISDNLKQLKIDSINKELETIKNDVAIKIQTLTLAKTDDERKKAIIDLNNSIHR